MMTESSMNGLQSPVVAIGPSSFGEADAAPLRQLESAGVLVKPNPFGRRLNEEEIIAHLDGVDGLIAGLEPLNARVLESAPTLKVIARVGIGMDNVDQGTAEHLGICVSNTPDGPTAAVAEMTLAALLTLSRRLVELNEDLHRREWRKRLAPGLAGRTALIIGLGRIGRRVADLLPAFGVCVLGCDPALATDEFPTEVEAVSLAEGLAAAQIISLHAGGNQPILGQAELAHLSQGCLLLNSARGSLVEEQALISALEDGRLTGIWMDAFGQEPYEGPLCDYPQALLTPHVCTYTTQCRSEMEGTAVANLLRDLGHGVR